MVRLPTAFRIGSLYINPLYKMMIPATKPIKRKIVCIGTEYTNSSLLFFILIFYNQADKSNNNMKCPICYDKIVKDMFISFCGHIFHNNCIEEWCLQRENCPICRRTLKYRLNAPLKSIRFGHISSGLTIPLPFWFADAYTLAVPYAALPDVALPYETVRRIVDFRTFDELLRDGTIDFLAFEN